NYLAHGEHLETKAVVEVLGDPPAQLVEGDRAVREDGDPAEAAVSPPLDEDPAAQDDGAVVGDVVGNDASDGKAQVPRGSLELDPVADVQSVVIGERRRHIDRLSGADRRRCRIRIALAIPTLG